MNQPSKYRIALAGSYYSIISDEPEELVSNAVAFIEKIVHDMRAKNPHVDTHKALALAALHSALELVKIQQQRHVTSTTIVAMTDFVTAQLMTLSQ